MSITCYLLSPRGFCSGVTRAANMAEQVLRLYKTVYSIEDVIHNKVFVDSLCSQGFVKVESIDDIPDGSAIMFSAHGVSPRMLNIAEDKGLTIIDGTCPIVKSIQQGFVKAIESGSKAIIIGNRSHAEIIALLGYARDSEVYVVYNEMDIDMLPSFDNLEVTYFTQTTLDCDYAKKIIDKLKEKIPHIKSTSQDNICTATKMRQDAVKKMAGDVDLVIIVGSSYSSNAKRLCEVAESAGAKKVLRIDSKNELNDSDFNGITSLAISSAASTPESIVQDLVAFIESKYDLDIKDFADTKNDN